MSTDETANRLTAFVSQLQYDDLADDTRQAAKSQLADNLGCILAARSHPALARWRRSLVRWGAEGVSGNVHALGSDGPALPLLQAAAVDGYAARVFDFDAVHDPTGDHPFSSVAPVLLALSGTTMVSGPDLLTGFLAGTEAQLRVRLGTPQRLGTVAGTHPWTSGTYAPFGASMAAARVLRLGHHDTLLALGRAFTYCSNTVQSHHEGRTSHLSHHAMSSANGMQAALMSVDGWDGIEEPLEGAFGFYHSFHDDDYDRDRALGGLGERFHAVESSIKLLPICRLGHPVVEALAELTRQEHASADRIEKVLITVNGPTFALMVADDRAPVTLSGAQYHLRYNAALALTGHTLDIETLQRLELAEDPDVARMLDRIDIRQGMDEGAGQLGVCTVQIQERDGTVRLAEGRGSDALLEQVKLKFLGNCRVAGMVDEAAAELWELTQAIEVSNDTGRDIREIVARSKNG